MRYILCIVALMLTACGPKAPSIKKTIVAVDSAIAPYFQRFEQDIGVSSAGISGSFVILTAPTVGECLTWDTGEKDIQIDPAYWATATDDQREQLVFHELGHCAMSLQHIPGVDSSGCPISIMYPYTFGTSNCYLNNKSYYFHELASHR